MKLKKKPLIILIIILIILIIGIYYLIFKNKNDISYKDLITININDKLPKDIEYKLNKETKKAEINWDINDASKLGTYKGTFKVDNKKYEVTLVIEDTKAPEIKGVKNLQTTINKEIDFFEGITVQDNSEEKITPIVKGDYNLAIAGTYNLYYEATDKSGNKTKEEFTLEVSQTNTSVIPLDSPSVPATNESKVIGKSSKGYTIELINGVTYVDGILIANKTYPLPNDYAPGFTDEANYAYGLLRKGALDDGFNIFTLNSYRSYIDQKIIYNDYVTRDGKENADTYSARPGHSEHQSGLAVDVNSLDQDWENTPEGKWLSANCYKYGFIIRYPKGKEKITGYIYEPWHIRYVGTEIAQKLYNNGDWITLEEYLGITSEYND